MKKILLLIPVLLMTLASCASSKKSDIILPMGESEITLPGGAKGTLLLAEDRKSPFVIMYHGYASTRDEVGNMFADTARELEIRGISSLRIGFRGWDGTTEFDETFITVHTMMQDAQEALDYVMALPAANRKRIGLLGFSMGGGVAQYIAGTNPKEIASVATWSSSIEYASLLNREDKATAMNKGEVTMDLGWRTITHSREFAESLSAYNTLEVFREYKKRPFLIVDGTEDYLYTNTAVLKTVHPRAEVFEVPRADHIYNVLSGDTLLADTVIAKTAQWFRKTLD